MKQINQPTAPFVLLVSLVSISIVALHSCKKDKFITDTSAKLEFSVDSILFDTVFTTVGSVTDAFKVYNQSSQPIIISSIKLASGTSSNFRINVDGSKGVTFTDVEIAGKDSMFVFVEVTVDPNNGNNPLIIRDSVVFETNGNIQDVQLEAWGQDAYFHTPNNVLVFSNGASLAYSVIPCNAIWTNDKPHVIYGFAVVDSGCTLTINQGAKIHLHPGGVLWVYKDGTLIVNGNQSMPVIFQGDRLEPKYSELPGQWRAIWLSAGSKNNTIDWAIIKNGFIGLQVDTMGASANPTLTIRNSIVKNMSVVAIFSQGGFITGSNSLFANCGQYVAALTIGGRYDFYHCTFANYWTGGTRQFPTLLLNNYYEDVNKNIISRNLDSASFYNCIVYGDISSGEEVKLEKSSNTSFTFNYKFHHTLLRTGLDTSGSEYVNVKLNLDPYFNSVGNNDYRIKNPFSLPGVIDKGDPAIGIIFPDDLSGKSRMVNGNPDIGAYEYEP